MTPEQSPEIRLIESILTRIDRTLETMDLRVARMDVTLQENTRLIRAVLERLTERESLRK
jgi:hypothetical protein